MAETIDEPATRQLDYESRSAADTIRIGGEIAALLTPPCLLILRGSLGAGKTTLVKGVAEALHAAEPDEVTSPTFTLIHEYEGSRLVDGREAPVMLYHLDLYRLETERQVEALGIAELATAGRDPAGGVGREISRHSPAQPGGDRHGGLRWRLAEDHGHAEVVFVTAA